MESALLGLILDSSVIVEAERKGQTVEQLLEQVGRSVGEVEIAICSVTVAELVHGVYRANTREIRQRRRAFIDELKRHVPVHPVTDETGEIIGRISGEQAAQGYQDSVRRSGRRRFGVGARLGGGDSQFAPLPDDSGSGGEAVLSGPLYPTFAATAFACKSSNR